MNATEKMPTDLATLSGGPPMLIIQQAIASGASVESLERLMAMQERWDANEARKEFNAALAAAKSEIGPIVKDKKVDFTSGKGRTNYAYEDLESIASIVDPILSHHGLFYRYEALQDGMRLTVTCVLMHKSGHEARTSLTGSDDISGNKNGLQAIASAATYLQRYTLKLALGLATTKDTDGNTPREEDVKTIDAEQFRYLQDLIEKSGANEAKFLEVLGATELQNLTQAQYRTAEALLRKKIKQNELKGASNGNT